MIEEEGKWRVEAPARGLPERRRGQEQGRGQEEEDDKKEDNK